MCFSCRCSAIGLSDEGSGPAPARESHQRSEGTRVARTSGPPDFAFAIGPRPRLPPIPDELNWVTCSIPQAAEDTIMTLSKENSRSNQCSYERQRRRECIHMKQHFNCILCGCRTQKTSRDGVLDHNMLDKTPSCQLGVFEVDRDSYNRFVFYMKCSTPLTLQP